VRRHTDRWRFWIRRYGPAEVACLATMLAASVVAARLTTSPPLLAASAIAGATVGFYLVSALGYRLTELAGVRAPRSPTPPRANVVSHM